MSNDHADAPRSPASRDLVLWAALAGTFVLYLVHIELYAFLTDDAYISFRYARNLSDGFGLVFNPGYERVEGYTNFLWVLILAGFTVLGASPETVAVVLSILFSVALWALVVWFGFRGRPARHRLLFIALPPLYLAATRSVAVWSTGGLETRLFELLVLSGALRLVVEVERMDRSGAEVRPVAALLFALATLTRPDGLLIAACALGAATLARASSAPRRLRWIASSAGVYALLVGAHFAFRIAYYGDWLPNTYYAKVDGRSWWEMGFHYLACFSLEYAIYLWIPLLAAGWVAYRRRGQAVVPMIFAAICLPHALYVASTGGDHFEYRPLDLYFPFAYLLMAAGAVELCRSRTAARLVFVYTAIVLVGIVEIPYRSHVEFPAEYSHGFPGKRALKVGGDRFLDPARSWVYRLPGLRAIAAGHQALLRESTRHFVGVRQEEHRLFLDRVVKEGKRLRTLVAEGVLPADTHVAVCCVGAIPYYSDLRTLDRFGLTDRAVARGDFLRPDMIAHGKYAGFDYAVERGVDLWAIDPVHLLHDARNPHFVLSVSNAHHSDWDAYFAEVDEHLYLLVGLPGGFGSARARFPRLTFQSTRDGAAVNRLAISLGATVVETRDEKID